MALMYLQLKEPIKFAIPPMLEVDVEGFWTADPSAPDASLGVPLPEKSLIVCHPTRIQTRQHPEPIDLNGPFLTAAKIVIPISNIAAIVPHVADLTP